MRSSMKLSFNPRHWNAGILAIAGLAVALFLCPRAVFGLTGADPATRGRSAFAGGSRTDIYHPGPHAQLGTGTRKAGRQGLQL